MLMSSSRIREASSTSRTMPVPSHDGQAPTELKASSSAPGAWTFAPQFGQAKGSSAATLSVGSFRWPFGQTCDARRENMSRTTLSSLVDVPKVDLTPGIPGRCRRARAAGT